MSLNIDPLLGDSDLRMYYAETLIHRVEEDGSKTLLYVEGATREAILVREFDTKSGGFKDGVALPIDTENIYDTLPHTGYVNLGGRSHYIVMTQKKSYKRGLSTARLKMKPVSLLREGHTSPSPLNN